MKPLIFYVDDEQHNLTLLEASLPAEWSLMVFSDPMKALEALNRENPWVILSDQKMPGITGVNYLEIAKKMHPFAIRLIVTGYSEEDLVVESVRKAQVFDYIKKPWEPELLEASLRRAIEHYRVNKEARDYHEALMEREKRLSKQNSELQVLTANLKNSHQREAELRKELECWVPPFLLGALKENEMRFPIKRDIVGLAYDIIGSHQTHKFVVNGRPFRSAVIHAFSEVVLRNGGWRESHAGDSAYAHFGLWDETGNAFESALGAAREFRVALRTLSQVHNIPVECGIAIHVSRETIVDVHRVQLTTPRGPVIQKSFDTTSIDIDLLHRMEKLVHSIPGTNIIISGEAAACMKSLPANTVVLGWHQFGGANRELELHLLPSDQIKAEDIERLKSTLFVPVKDPVKKAA